MIRLVLYDDQHIVTEGMELIFEMTRGFEVTGVAHDGAEAADLVAKEQPDLVLMDLRMPIMNGVQATRRIREVYPERHVLVLTSFDDDHWVFDAIRAGADGYLLKDTPREQLIEAIRGTVGGQTHVAPSVAGKLFRQVSQPQASATLDTEFASELSERELDVLRLIAEGYTDSQIAERLHLSKGTIQNYVSTILVKLDVGDRTQAAVLALRHGITTGRT